VLKIGMAISVFMVQINDVVYNVTCIHRVHSVESFHITITRHLAKLRSTRVNTNSQHV